MESVVFLAIILLVGTLSSIVAYKIKISNVLFLIVLGILLNQLGLNQFSKEFLVTITVMALVMIIFSNSVKFKLKDIGSYSSQAVKLSVVFFMANLTVMSLATFYLFNMKVYVVALVFAGLSFGIDPGITLSMLGSLKKRVVKIIEIESLINAPVTVIVPLTLLGVLGSPMLINYISVSQQFIMFVLQFVVALIVGVVFGIIVTRSMETMRIGNLAYALLFTAPIVAYILGEFLKGSGVLTVAVFGVYFGNYHIRKQVQLERFTIILSDMLKIVVFILIGTMVVLTNELHILVKGTLLFILHLIVRFLSVYFSLDKATLKEKLFLSLNVPKGIDVAVVSLMIISSYSHLKDIDIVLALIFIFMILSISLSTIITRFSQYFLRKNVKKIKRN